MSFITEKHNMIKNYIFRVIYFPKLYYTKYKPNILFRINSIQKLKLIKPNSYTHIHIYEINWLIDIKLLGNKSY